MAAKFTRRPGRNTVETLSGTERGAATPEPSICHLSIYAVCGNSATDEMALTATGHLLEFVSDACQGAVMLATLAHRNFALLWAGQTMSAIGNRMFPIVLAVVVLDRGWG